MGRHFNPDFLFRHLSSFPPHYAKLIDMLEESVQKDASLSYVACLETFSEFFNWQASFQHFVDFWKRLL